MQTQIQNTDTNETNNTNNTNTIPNTANHPTIKRLARMPHVIALPSETPPPSELKHLIEARIAEIKSQQSRLNLKDEDQAFEFAANKSILSILHQHLDELCRDFPELVQPSIIAPLLSTNAKTPNASTAHIGPLGLIGPHTPTSLTKNNSAEITETNETNLQPQQHPAETEARQVETISSPGEIHPWPSNSDPVPEQNSCDEQFAAELQKIPEQYREAAAELYENLHHRAKFARLTSAQREAIYELCKHHSEEEVVKVIAEPPPVGMNFKTSRASLYRFCGDFKRILFDEQKLQAHQRNQQDRLAAEQSFQTANASDDSFRKATAHQIRKRVFLAANNPGSDYHEIRWLLKSLELLEKPNAKQSTA